jgi:hypothetical protein
MTDRALTDRLGEDVADILAKLSGEQVAELNRLVDAAFDRQSAALAEAPKKVLNALPSPLRGAVRRMLGA